MPSPSEGATPLPLSPPVEEQLFAQSTLRGLEALVHQVRQLEQLRRQYVDLARVHVELEDEAVGLRAALHLIGQTYISTRSAEERLDLIVDIVHRALGREPTNEPKPDREPTAEELEDFDTTPRYDPPEVDGDPEPTLEDFSHEPEDPNG